ncbi:hypothetical protein [Chroococcus sp. FPU101]|uniref:hypothetical protein n=1 Tax=Chroococcus sp. FPU101 TaxID=1974212 RepID=UPI001A8D0F56|nr:hypothetical protein [Chroococcus sp. FPU101]GFE67952.1 hypothetical protein CFPU101_05620 [Chroococcus sp. FPU101]
MDTLELKFLLKLLSKDNYQASLSEIKLNDKTKAAERNKICRQLRDRKLIDCKEEIKTIKLTPDGKNVLKLENSPYPLSREEQKILQACQQGAIKPSQIKKILAKTRDELIQKFIDKGYLEVASTEIKEVSLSEKGQEFLANEYQPTGEENFILSSSMLKGYLSLIRKFILVGIEHQKIINQDLNLPKPNDDEILQTIINLDQELGTENFLPIFYLREKLQPPLSRNELDQALYRLEKQDKLELSTLVESVHYTPEQIQAGIPQGIGGCLFFLITN